jgi:protein-S-isoprenylcysteine O-methyltransferase Ste14
MPGSALTGELPYRLLAALLLGVAVGISGFYRSRAERAGGPLRSSSGGVLVALRLVGALAILPVVAYLLHPPWVSWARMPLPSPVRWAAGALGIALLPALVWIFRTIGLNISPSHVTRHGHTLVTDGPYRWVRHPLYSVGTLLCVALGLLTALWWPLTWLVPSLALLHWRTPREEARLVEAFGDRYLEYMRGTGRYLPRWHPRAPETRG